MTTWAPIVGSSLVAISALITLFFTVRENGKALAVASRQHSESLEHLEMREWNQWKREKLTEYCEEILKTGQQVIGSLRGCVYWERSNFVENFVEQSNRISSLSNVYRKLELIVDDELDDAAKRNYKTLANVLEKAKEEFELKAHEDYLPGSGLRRLEPACKAATEALRGLTHDTRRLMGDSESQSKLTESSPPSDPEPELELPPAE